MLSINLEDNIPININVNTRVIMIASLKLFSKFRDSGIRSVILTHIITPDANDSDDAIILFSFFILISIGNVPSNVDSPDIVVNKKDKVILFI